MSNKIFTIYALIPEEEGSVFLISKDGHKQPDLHDLRNDKYKKYNLCNNELEEIQNYSIIHCGIYKNKASAKLVIDIMTLEMCSDKDYTYTDKHAYKCAQNAISKINSFVNNNNKKKIK